MTHLNNKLADALRELLNHVDRETCVHESTHRGGALWTICDGCGMKWADDRGGFVPHTDAVAVAQAREAIAEHDAQPAPAPVQAACRCLECGAEAGEPCAEECTHILAPAADGAGELLRMVATNIRSNLYSLPSIASDWVYKIDVAIAALRQPVPDAVRELPIELADVAHELADGSGSWTPCSGCYETSDGYNVAGFPYSDVFRCNLGGGCRECGGIGAVWEEAASASLESALASQQESRNAD
jgi:hypothetical protein